jgi:hypothetical protein
MSKNHITSHEARNIARKLTPMIVQQLADRIQEMDASLLEELDTAESQYQAAFTRRRIALDEIFHAIQPRR